MFAYLQGNSDITATAINNRVYDMIKLFTGAYSSTDQLNSVYWNKPRCLVNTSQRLGNWNAVYCSLGTLEDLKTSGSTSFSVFLTKPSANFPAKTYGFKFARTASTFELYAGTFNGDGTSSNVTAAVSFTGSVFAANQVGVIASGQSSAFFNTASSALAYAIERTAYPYDENTSESLVIVGGNTTGLISNIYNPRNNNNYVAYTPTFNVYTATKLSRDSMGLSVPALTPLSVEKYDNGWAGGNMSTYSGLYSIGNTYYNAMDRLVVDGVNYRVTAMPAYRYAVVEG